MKLPNSSSRKALIVKFGQIGDVIMALPAAHALFEQGYAIDWVCGRAAQPLLASYSWIQIVPVDDRAIFRGSWLERAKAIADFWRRILPRRYDLCATLYYDRRFHLLTRPVRATHKVALSRESRSTSLLAGRHHADEYMRLLLDQQDGCRESSALPVRPDRLPMSPLPAKRAETRVALAPGGASNVLGEQVLRRWPIERYVELTRLLLARGCEVVLLGGAEDAWVGPYFEGLPVNDCVGSFTLSEVISVCDTCDAVVTHDTGPLHLAGLSRACIVGVFGPTDPSTRVPRRPGVVGVWGGQGFACRPCYDGRDFAPCQFNGCMHQVSAELVLRQLDRLLAVSSLTPVPWCVVCPEAGVNLERLSPGGHQPEG